MEPWPLDSTKRSRLAQAGLLGLCCRWRAHKATAMSAMPMGAPGWPELACCTASMASARMALAMVWDETVVATAVSVMKTSGGNGPRPTTGAQTHGLGQTRDFTGWRPRATQA